MHRSTNRIAAPLGLWLTCLLCLGAAAPVAQAQLATPNRTSPRHGAVNVPTSVELRWQPVSGAVGYEWRLLRNGAIARSGNLQGMNTTQTTLQNLYAAQAYTWQVRALANRQRNHSPWSNQWRFTTLNTVRLLTPANGAVQVAMPVRFSWTALNGVSRYELQTSTSPNFPNQAPNRTPHTSMEMHLAHTGEQTFYWRVRAIRDGVLLPWSTVASFRTAPGTMRPPDSGDQSSPRPTPIAPEAPELGRPVHGTGVDSIDRWGNLLPVDFGWQVRGGQWPATCQFELYRGNDISAGQLVDRRTLSATSLRREVEPLRQYTWRAGHQLPDGRVLWASPATFTALGTAVSGMRAVFDGRFVSPPQTWRQAALIWNHHRGATAYEVEIYDRAAGIGTIPGGPPSGSNTLLQRHLTGSTTLTLGWLGVSRPAWRVRARGELDVFGPWSEMYDLYPAGGAIYSYVR